MIKTKFKLLIIKQPLIKILFYFLTRFKFHSCSFPVHRTAEAVQAEAGPGPDPALTASPVHPAARFVGNAENTKPNQERPWQKQPRPPVKTPTKTPKLCRPKIRPKKRTESISASPESCSRTRTRLTASSSSTASLRRRESRGQSGGCTSSRGTRSCPFSTFIDSRLTCWAVIEKSQTFHSTTLHVLSRYVF